MLWRRLLPLSLLLALTGCTALLDGSSPRGGDGGALDGAVAARDGAAADGSAGDGGAACEEDADCVDGVYCNGSEVCDPTDSAADARGCAPGPAACGADEVCDEAGRACVDCDADGDGFDSAACEGTDCDDGDAAIHPDATEVCDDEGVDEDCDPSTLGDDADVDAHVSDACCNGDVCGDDCADDDASTYAGADELCDAVDNDCDRVVDEDVSDVTFYLDCDADGYGLASSAVTACAPPSVDPGCAVGAAWLRDTGDCDDTKADVYPGAPELCDGADNDCDLTADGAAADALCAAATVPHLGRASCSGASGCAITACEDGFDTCDGDFETGCETDLTSARTCGASCGSLAECGFVCALTSPRGCALPVAVAAGNDRSCARLEGAAGMTCWGAAPGSALPGLTAVPLPVAGLGEVTSVAVGVGHTCAVENGAVQCWGVNPRGQLGRTTATISGDPSPALVTSTAGLVNVVSVVAGDAFTCALTDRGTAEGRIFCWGDNTHGQLARSTPELSAAPLRIAGFGADEAYGPAIAIAAGGAFVCALTDDGAVRCWGENDRGQVGADPDTDPVRTPNVVATGTAISRLAAGASHVCAASANAIRCWGDGQLDQLGGATTVAYSASPVLVVLSGATYVIEDLGAGANHTCTVAQIAGSSSRAVLCWGSNSAGQTGEDPGVATTTPTAVAVTTFTTGAGGSVDGGAEHTCLLRPPSTVLCWGDNELGQLGKGDMTDTFAPTVTAAGP